jgi:hypothetical protein
MVLKKEKLKELVKEPTLNCPFFGSCLKKLAGSLKSFKNPRPTVISLPQNKISFKDLEPETVTKGRGFRVTKEPPNTG